jgi:hypothetical protein
MRSRWCEYTAERTVYRSTDPQWRLDDGSTAIRRSDRRLLYSVVKVHIWSWQCRHKTFSVSHGGAQIGTAVIHPEFGRHSNMWRTTWTTSKWSLAFPPLNCIREVTNSNLCRDTQYPDRGCHGFFSLPQDNIRESAIKLGQNHLHQILACSLFTVT